MTDTKRANSTKKGVVFPHKPKTFAAKLPILLSCRIRLDDKQRNTLKTAYRAYRDTNVPAAAPAIGGSGLVTSTVQQAPALIQGWSDVVISDLISTRETIPLQTILMVQKALDVEVITGEDVMKACQHYVDYVFEAENE